MHIDPLCPWAWQTARWMAEVAAVRPVEVSLRLFSLELLGSHGDEPLRSPRSRSAAALRTLALARRRAGEPAAGRLYRCLGARIHDEKERATPEVLAAAAHDAGLPQSLVDDALSDETTIADVRADHDLAVEGSGAFGVPTIVLESGRAIFGPVIAVAPRGEAAGDLWDHVRYLVDLDGFFELKRDRDRRPGAPRS